MHNSNKLLTAASIILVSLIAFACAKQGFPSGGPKDTTPPTVLLSTPPSGTTEFDQKQFVLDMDEYVTIKDADNNILVSPPMTKKPEYSTRGRSVVVKLNDTLRSNTTYLFQFKEGIVDFNEGNPLSSYEYVFSTGSSIDSMTLRGRVVDAFTAKPRTETVTVTAYAESQMTDSIGDSVVSLVQPMYLTRCDKEGNFALNHMREGRYRIIAFEDGDKNMRLDTDEPVAFLDTLVTAWHMPAPIDTTQKQQTDSSLLDTTAIADSATIITAVANTLDTSMSDTAIADTLPELLLRLSETKHDVQRVVKSEFTRRGHIEIVTQVPLSADYSLTHLTADSTSTAVRLWHSANKRGDTISVWLANDKCDSISLLLTDSTGIDDTLQLQFQEKQPANRKGLQANERKTLLSSAVASSHPYFDTLWLAVENPIALITDSARCDTAVSVLDLTDSTTQQCGIAFAPHHLADSLPGNRPYLLFDGKAGKKYQFTIPSGLMKDIYGNTNDSLSITTEYTKTESYGNIRITLQAKDSLVGTGIRHWCDSLGAQLIVQLTNEKGDMLRQNTVDHPTLLSFEHLKAGKYSLRIIIDIDKDGNWTAGDYWMHRQPEEIILFDKTLELRENWDMEEKWML